MEKMRALLAAEEEKNQNKGSGDSSSGKIGDSPVYPHWSIPLDSIATLRFLPDGNPTNPFFWVERAIRKIPFAGVKGLDTGTRRIEVQVPDLNAFEKNLDPIQQVISPWWNEGRKEEYRTYKKRLSYIYQGFVRVHPGFVDSQGKKVEDAQPENPIRRFIMAPKIHEMIKAIIMNAKIKHSPIDYEHGRDFDIHLRKQGEHNNYDSSAWSFEEDSLRVEELEAIEQFGLFDLSEFVPSKPSDDHIKAIAEMFEASLAGLPYDPERWADYYRPAGIDLSSDNKKTQKTEESQSESTKTTEMLEKLKNTSTPADNSEKTETEKAETEKTETEKTEVSETKTEKKTTDTAALLAKLRNRNQSQ